MQNLTVVSTVFWPCILGIITIALNLFLIGKSNRCFNSFLAVHLGIITIALNLFLNGKSIRCFNNFFGRAF